MLIKYCSLGLSTNYGTNIFSVDYMSLPTSDESTLATTYKYIIELDVDADSNWGCPNTLVIDNTGEQLSVREKTENELVIDMKPSISLKIQEKKNEMRDGGFDVDGTHFDSDMSARVAYTELAMQIQENPSFTTVWKASEGVWVTMNAELFSKVATNGQACIQNAFTWQSEMDTALSAAKTFADLNAINI